MKIINTLSKQYVSTDIITDFYKSGSKYYLKTNDDKVFEIDETSYNLLVDYENSKTISYNDLRDKPTILGDTVETWTFTLDDDTVITKNVVIEG